MSAIDLHNETYFPVEASCPSEIKMALDPSKKLPELAWFLIVDIIREEPVIETDYIEVYAARFLVMDKKGVEFSVAFVLNSAEASRFPIEKLHVGVSLILKDAVMTTLVDNSIGVIMRGVRKIKIVPCTVKYLLKTNDRVHNARGIENGKHLCFACDKECEPYNKDAGRCDGCTFFYFCSKMCNYIVHNYKWHGLECTFLQDDDLAALFSGNWDDIHSFANICLIQKRH
ncbi:hypothetical protein BJY01DRAFT_250559 [Aspergillus pseudoustus]|uniref:MYND-type domain-containing protein n=1 Tax=Aspergillus pseudoustus TaxID=1810923 RepID=A0ABR4JH58_9EURO